MPKVTAKEGVWLRPRFHPQPRLSAEASHCPQPSHLTSATSSLLPQTQESKPQPLPQILFISSSRLLPRPTELRVPELLGETSPPGVWGHHRTSKPHLLPPPCCVKGRTTHLVTRGWPSSLVTLEEWAGQGEPYNWRSLGSLSSTQPERRQSTGCSGVGEKQNWGHRDQLRASVGNMLGRRR